MRRREPPEPQLSTANPAAESLSRARRARKRQDLRGEITALRQASLFDEYDPVLFTLLGAALIRAGKSQEAAQALKHALWLRERAQDPLRAAVLRQLLACAVAGTSIGSKAA
jgi:Flp pilus assembly protein TadD